MWCPEDQQKYIWVLALAPPAGLRFRWMPNLRISLRSQPVRHAGYSWWLWTTIHGELRADPGEDSWRQAGWHCLRGIRPRNNGDDEPDEPWGFIFNCWKHTASQRAQGPPYLKRHEPDTSVVSGESQVSQLCHGPVSLIRIVWLDKQLDSSSDGNHHSHGFIAGRGVFSRDMPCSQMQRRDEKRSVRRLSPRCLPSLKNHGRNHLSEGHNLMTKYEKNNMGWNRVPFHNPHTLVKTTANVWYFWPMFISPINRCYHWPISLDLPFCNPSSIQSYGLLENSRFYFILVR